MVPFMLTLFIFHQQTKTAARQSFNFKVITYFTNKQKLCTRKSNLQFCCTKLHQNKNLMLPTPNKFVNTRPKFGPSTKKLTHRKPEQKPDVVEPVADPDTVPALNKLLRWDVNLKKYLVEKMEI